MATVAPPSFADGMALSARAITDLDFLIDDLITRARAVRVPVEFRDNTATSAVPALKVYDAYAVHRHPDGHTEYLWLDLGMWNASGGGKTVTVKVFYRAFNSSTGWGASDINQATDTPLETFTTSSGSEQAKRALKNVTSFPPGAHPNDADMIHVEIWAYASGGDSCSCNVYAVEQIIWPASDYIAMNDALALTDGEKEDVAADLMHVVGNCAALDAIYSGDIPGFRCLEKDLPVSTGAWTEVGRWHWYTPKGKTLRYAVRLRLDKGKENQKVGFKFKINGNEIMSPVYLTEHTAFSQPAYRLYEGEIDLSADPYGSWWSSVLAQDRLSIIAYGQYYCPDGDDHAGSATVQILYLGEVGPGDYADFGIINHGNYVEGTVKEGYTGCLRRLWTHTLALANDTGTGYASGQDVDNGLPVGRALWAHRSPVIERGVRPYVTPLGRVNIVDAGKDNHDVQQMAFYRVHDFLYYRVRGGSLVYIGEDGEEVSRALEDYDDDNPYHVFDLSTIEDLTPDTLYFVRVDMTTIRSVYPEDLGEDVLEFAFERED